MNTRLLGFGVLCGLLIALSGCDDEIAVDDMPDSWVPASAPQGDEIPLNTGGNEGAIR